MAINLDTRIPLGAQSSFDPARAFESAMQVQQLQQNAALAPMRVQQAQQEMEANAINLQNAQQRQADAARDQQEQDAIDSLVRQHGTGDGQKLLDEARKIPAIRADRLMKFQQYADQQAAAAKAKTAADNALVATNNKKIAGVIGEVLQEKDPVAQKSLLLGNVQRGHEEGWLSDDLYNQGLAMANSEGPLDVPQLQQLERHFGGIAAVHEREAATQKQEADDRQRQADILKQKGTLRTEFYRRVSALGKDLDEDSYAELRSDPEFKLVAGDYPRTLTNQKTGRTAATTLEQIRRSARTVAEQDKFDADSNKRDQSVSELEAIAAGLRADPKNKGNSEDAILGMAAKELRNRENQSKLVGKKDEDSKESDRQLKDMDQRIRELQRLKDSASAESSAQGQAATNAQAEIDKLLGEGTTEANRNERMRNLTDSAIQAKITALARKRDEASAASKAAQTKFKEHDDQQKAVQAEKESAFGGEEVAVVAPDGREGTIPRSKLDAALKRGFKTK